jgi:hypothetical protein
MNYGVPFAFILASPIDDFGVFDQNMELVRVMNFLHPIRLHLTLYQNTRAWVLYILVLHA